MLSPPALPDLPLLPDLPVAEALPALLAALGAGRNAVLVAPPGAGKTTLAPLALLDAPWRRDGRILLLEPRRLAARAAATRMAALRGETVGDVIGVRTRLDDATSAATRVEVVTEGILLRRLQADPVLDGVAAVILDEVHERALDADLALAFCLDLQRELRPELRLLAMSATADGARLAGLMDAEVIVSEGRMFPVEVRHAARDIAAPRDLPGALAEAVRTALAAERGDILAFLPGATVLPLHGDLPPAQQDRALAPADGRRVVLASAIAETSLTVPGVRVVIDGGWRRAPRLDAASGLTRLVTMRVSRAAADQRAGRAGREAPGVAVRLWTTALHRGLAAFDRPEILETELSAMVLDCAGWGAAPADLKLLDQPPAGAWAAGVALLTGLGALDEAGRITDAGRRMLHLGGHPRLAAMMLAAGSDGERALAADIAALLEERDPWRAPDAPADILPRLAALAAPEHDPRADRGAVARIRRTAAQYRRRLRLASRVAAAGDAGRLIAAAFPDRIAQRRGEPGAFRLSGGGGAELPRADPLATARLLAVAAMQAKPAARIRLAAPLDPDDLPPALAARVSETVETTLDPVSGAVLSRRRRRLGALVLSDRTMAADPAATEAVLLGAAAVKLPWTPPARQLQARVALMGAIEPDAGWPDLSDASLAAEAASWLAPHLTGLGSLAEVQRLDLAALLRGLLPGSLRGRLDRELPAELALPGGRAAVDYAAAVPVAAARAQAFYGLAETPRLAGGRIPLQLALLSPAQRPVAITADLAGFWKGAWAEVRRDMRGRYPKHDWPEDPARPR
jgi:ATP-dependent helicase HrpB